MLEAAIFPQKYDGRVMPPEMNQGCSEGRKSEGGREAELRVHRRGPHGWEVDLPGCHLARRGERGRGVCRKTVAGHCVRIVEFSASLYYGISLLWTSCWQIGWMRVGVENRGDGQDSVGEAIIRSVSRRLARCSKSGSCRREPG